MFCEGTQHRAETLQILYQFRVFGLMQPAIEAVSTVFFANTLSLRPTDP